MFIQFFINYLSSLNGINANNYIIIYKNALIVTLTLKIRNDFFNKNSAINAQVKKNIYLSIYVRMKFFFIQDKFEKNEMNVKILKNVLNIKKKHKLVQR